MFRTIAVLAGLLVASPVAAQVPEDPLRQIAALQQQVDELRALVTTRTAYPDTGLRVHTDWVVRIADIVWVGGWALECGGNSVGTVELEIDGIVVRAYVLRTERPDVQSVFRGSCPHLPLQTGVVAGYYLGAFAETTHQVRLRVKNADGITRLGEWRPFNVCRTDRDGNRICQ